VAPPKLTGFLLCIMLTGLGSAPPRARGCGSAGQLIYLTGF